MEEIDKLNNEEDEIYPEKTEEFARCLSDKLNRKSEEDKKIKKMLKLINSDYLPRLKKYNKHLEIIEDNRNRLRCYIHAYERRPYKKRVIKAWI